MPVYDGSMQRLLSSVLLMLLLRRTAPASAVKTVNYEPDSQPSLHSNQQQWQQRKHQRELITIENEKAREEAIDPDEYLWETLPGRCCFMQYADDCDMCNVWSDPQNFCHSSKESCELCGMSLYCPAPPPLLNADKVCVGESRVGMGCNDDLDTGLCQTAGALAACQSACRHTKHCEMIALYTDSMAGTCVLCRNMLNFEPTGQAATRVYAVEHLDMAPPSPPGYEEKITKHFSVLQDPSPPPPPHPPPSPPRAPPPPLPAALGTRTDTHIECEFFEDMDLSIVSAKGTGHHFPSGISVQTIDTTADTKKHCCSKCGMQAGCTDFVFEPSSKTCMLMPPVPSYMLRRSPNNSTIAGAVTISRLNQHHASCHFNVGSGYSGGKIGIGKPLPGKKMESQQDCCDSCERDPRCAKFVFEHFGGDCQLFGPEAEHYYTFNLLSGTVDGRADEEADTRGGSVGDEHAVGGGGEEGETGLDDEPDWMKFDETAPPQPPLMSFATPPPPPPPDVGEGGVAQTVLADFSLFMGFLIMFGFSLCGYLFFSREIQMLIFTLSGGLLGKQDTKSLLPVADLMARPAEPEERSRNKKGELLPGYSKVTVQTSQLEQKKEIMVGGCQTLADLHELIWDEFGHLLKTTRVKDTIVLVWASDEAPQKSKRQQALARWMKVTEASDMSKVVACGAIKLRDKKALDHKALAVAFASALTDGKKDKKKKKAERLALKNKEEDGADAEGCAVEEEQGDAEGDGSSDGEEDVANGNEDGSEEEDQSDGNEEEGEEREEADGGAAAALGGGRTWSQRRKGGFARLAAESQSSDEGGADEPLCSDAPVPREDAPPSARSSSNSSRATAGRSPGKVGNRGNREKKGGKAKKGDATEVTSSSNCSPAKSGGATRRSATVNDDDLDAADAARDLVGKRVEVHGLKGQAELNGRRGQVTAFDDVKTRFRVKLEAHPTKGAAKLLAFKFENLRKL